MYLNAKAVFHFYNRNGVGILSVLQYTFWQNKL